MHRRWWTLFFIPLSLAYQGKHSFSAQALATQHTLCNSTPTGPIETTLCDYESIDSVNDQLYTVLRNLVQTPFFRYFQVDLYRECPFWQENGFCMNRECAITTVDEASIALPWTMVS
jgi:hypothetical protein